MTGSVNRWALHLTPCLAEHLKGLEVRQLDEMQRSTPKRQVLLDVNLNRMYFGGGMQGELTGTAAQDHAVSQCAKGESAKVPVSLSLLAKERVY